MTPEEIVREIRRRRDPQKGHGRIGWEVNEVGGRWQKTGRLAVRPRSILDPKLTAEITAAAEGIKRLLSDPQSVVGREARAFWAIDFLFEMELAGQKDTPLYAATLRDYLGEIEQQAIALLDYTAPAVQRPLIGGAS